MKTSVYSFGSKKNSLKNKYGFAYVTTRNKKEAKNLAQFCIKEKLSACVNIFPPIVSVYSWKGKLVNEEEIALLIKTREDLFPVLCTALIKKHNYETPCIVYIPFSKGYKKFFSWMDLQLQKKSTKQ